MDEPAQSRALARPCGQPHAHTEPPCGFMEVGETSKQNVSEALATEAATVWFVKSLL